MTAKSGLMFFTYGEIKQMEKNALIYYIKYIALKGFRTLIKLIIPHIRLPVMIVSHVKIIAF